MTKLEKRVLGKILENLCNPRSGSDTAQTYSMDGGLHETGKGDFSEAIRRLDSDDYKLGWRKCWEEFRDRPDFLANSDVKGQQKYAGRG